MFRMGLLVIRCTNVARMVDFYERLGLELVEEQHDTGPVHYAATSVLGQVLELYPAGKKAPTTDLRLALEVRSLEEAKKLLAGLRRCDNLTSDGQGFEVYDPQNNVVEVREM